MPDLESVQFLDRESGSVLKIVEFLNSYPLRYKFVNYFHLEYVVLDYWRISIQPVGNSKIVRALSVYLLMDRADTAPQPHG